MVHGKTVLVRSLVTATEPPIPVGLDPDVAWLRFAKARGGTGPSYCSGRAERLPFPDRSFDRTVSVTALCFIRDQRRAVREIVRAGERVLVRGRCHGSFGLSAVVVG
jgi:ubiquinone/menaquinone biosynthesis C-methylase UbiE